MRPFLAFSVVAVILGGLQLYMVFRPQPTFHEAPAEAEARGRFSIDITLTFDAGPDAFALDLNEAPALLVQLRGRDLLRRTETIAAGESIRVDDVSGIVVGSNEFFVQATPQDATIAIARAVRVRILRDEHPLTQQTLWSEPGEVVQGAVIVDVPRWSGAPAGRTTANPDTDAPVEVPVD